MQTIASEIDSSTEHDPADWSGRMRFSAESLTWVDGEADPFSFPGLSTRMTWAWSCQESHPVQSKEAVNLEETEPTERDLGSCWVLNQAMPEASLDTLSLYLLTYYAYNI